MCVKALLGRIADCFWITCPMLYLRHWPSLVFLAAVAGCSSSPSAAPQEAVAVVQPLPRVPLTIVTADGKRHAYRIEVARAPDEQAQGLMYRRRMGQDEGMIFPFSPSRPASFWMRNTYIPLDMIFLLADGRIESILADVPPLNEHERRSLGPVAAVLELNAGEAARIGATPGDLVEYDLRDLQAATE